MKNILGLVLIFCLAITPAIASEAQRKLSSDVITTSQVLKTTGGTIYSIEFTATSNGGFVTVLDTSGTNPSGKRSLGEIKEATASNSSQRVYGVEGIKAYQGIFVFISNGAAIVHYN